VSSSLSTPAAAIAPRLSENLYRPSRFVTRTRIDVTPSYVSPVSSTSSLRSGSSAITV
jgi:hypothetical protein